MKNEALSEQNSRLLLEARAAASSVAGGTAEGSEADDSVSERLNLIKYLLKEMKNKDDEIKSLRIKKVSFLSVLSEVSGCLQEDAWVKEHGLLCAETENHKMASKEADKRYRDLEMKNEALSEQNSRLLLEARAAASSVAGGTAEGSEADDSVSERLNLIKDLVKEMNKKDDEIKSLRIERVSYLSERLMLLENENQELDSFKSQNRDENRESKQLSEIGVLQSRVTCANVAMDGSKSTFYKAG